MNFYNISNKDELNDFFADYIIKQSSLLGISQSMLVEQTGLTQKTVSQIFNKKKRLSLWEVYSICRALYTDSHYTTSVLHELVNCDSCSFKRQVMNNLQPNVTPAKTGLLQFIENTPTSKQELLEVLSYVIQNMSA